jgi:hypothetical protein
MKWRTETCPRCGYTKQSRHVPSRKFRSSEAKWVEYFKANHGGIDPRELPHKYPADHRCQRCEGSPGRYRLTWDHDHWLERQGYPLAECSRGWVCRRCFEKLYWLDFPGDDDGSEYMLRVRDRLLLGSELDSYS